MPYFQVMRAVKAGYNSVINLDATEQDLIYDAIVIRFALSSIIGSRTIALEPDNEYVRKCVDEVIEHLEIIVSQGRKSFYSKFFE